MWLIWLIASYGPQVSATKFRELRAVNVDVNFDPVMDVNSNPQNPVIGLWSGSLRPQGLCSPFDSSLLREPRDDREREKERLGQVSTIQLGPGWGMGLSLSTYLLCAPHTSSTYLPHSRAYHVAISFGYPLADILGG